MVIHVRRSNVLHGLLDDLVETVSRPLATGLVPEILSVPNAGIRTWLSMRLSERFGVCANVEWPSPLALVTDVMFRALEVKEDDARKMAVEPLTFALMSAIADLRDREDFASIREYLASDETGTKWFGLSRRMARMFDRYAWFRPDMVRRWEAGDVDDWQGMLWNAAITKRRVIHVANALLPFVRTLREHRHIRDRLPARVTVFGVTRLPSLALDMLDALSSVCEVNLFILSPSHEYFGDAGRRDVLSKTDDAPWQPVHPLLGSWGRVARDFQQVLERYEYHEPPGHRFVAAGAACLLHAIQDDIQEAKDPHLAHDGGAKRVLRSGDRSIEVHACHGPAREVEVLHDQLRARLEDDPNLFPEDIVVLCPNIDRYVPHIDAVFGGARATPYFIPYHVADRPGLVRAGLIDALFQLCDLVQSRLLQSEVLDFLALRPIRAKFALDDLALDRIRTWVNAVEIRAFLDEDHRALFGLPRRRENTWRFGLDRLVLGYAMPAADAEPFLGVLPFGDVEGDSVQILQSLIETTRTLFSWVEKLRAPRSFSSWAQALWDAVEALFSQQGEWDVERRWLRQTLTDMADHANEVGLDAVVSLEAVKRFMTEHVESSRPTYGVMASGVTFALPSTMTGVPSPVVAFLGCNDGEFPRADRPLGFDHVFDTSRPGDPSLRDDDRFSFLSALLAAKSQFLVTYTGRSPRDDSRISESIVLGELADTVDATTSAAAAMSTKPRDTLAPGAFASLHVWHPANAFDPRYFAAERLPGLIGFRAFDAECARALSGGENPVAPFVRGAIFRHQDVASDSAPTQTVVELKDLADYFDDPAKFFVTRVLGMRSPKARPEFRDRPPLALDDLERWRLRELAARHRIHGRTRDEVTAIVRASGMLPHGTAGDCVLQDLLGEEMEDFVARVRATQVGPKLAPFLVDVRLDSFRIVGTLHALWPKNQAFYTTSKLKEKHRLRAWIHHLVWLACREASGVARTIHVARGTTTPTSEIAFGDVRDAPAHLVDLIALYRLGQTMPLPIVPEACAKVARTLTNRKTDDDGTKEDELLKVAAREVWSLVSPRGSYGSDNDSHDYLKRLVGETRKDLEAFLATEGVPSIVDLTRRVFVPMIASIDESDASP